MTRAQHDLVLAERLVSSLPDDRDLRDIYGGLCHSFPVLVRTCGLCQALAFHRAKAAGDTSRAGAHGHLLAHVGEVLGVGADPLDAVRSAGTLDYMLHTRRILEAWVYFKRFAVSILKVESSEGSRNA